MNFIKKKIKGSKKAITSDDDDLDPNLFHVPQVSEGAPEGWVPYDQRIDEESEEWQAFRQLTQRVTDTLQKTQQNLSKIVASSAVDEDGKDIKPVTTATTDQEVITDVTARPDRPPPRPPPPVRPPPPQPSQSTTATGPDFDLQLDFGFGPPVPRPTGTVPSILLTSGSLFLDDDETVASDEDDPFDTSFVSEVSVGKAVSPLDVDGFDVTVDDEDDPFVIKESILSAMDPFDSLLATGRAKSPNPFLADDRALELSSSNPFSDTVAADDDSFFVDRPVPNPFAAEVTQASDLLEMDFATPPTAASASVSVSAPRSDDIADLFGATPPTANPFTAPFAQPSAAAAIGDLFTLDPLDVLAPPLSSQTMAAFDSSANVVAAADATSDPFASVLGTEPTDVPDLFGFGAAPPKDSLTGFEPATVVDPFSEVTATPPKRDSYDAAAVFDSDFTPPTRPPPPAPKKADPEPAKKGPPRPPPPARPPPPTVVTAVAAAKTDVASPWDEAFGVEVKIETTTVPPPPPLRPPSVTKTDVTGPWEDAFGMELKSEATTAPPSVAARDPFDVFEAAGPEDAVPPPPALKPTAAVTSDLFGLDLLTDSTVDDKVEFEPIPAMVAKSISSNVAFDAFGSIDAPSLEPVKAAPLQPVSAIDLFSAMDSTAERKPVTSSDLPRPPSVEGLDAFGTTATDVDVVKPPQLPTTALDLMGGDVDLLAPSDDAAPFTDADTAFDVFEAKFQSAQGQSASDAFDPFTDAVVAGGSSMATAEMGFGAADEFDPFLAMKEPPAAPKPSPARFAPQSQAATDVAPQSATAASPDSDSDDSGPDFSVFIRPKMRDKDDVGGGLLHLGPIPALAPPPKSPLRSPTHAASPRFNPFDKDPGSAEDAHDVEAVPDDVEEEEEPTPQAPPPHDLPVTVEAESTRKSESAAATGESQESPGSPLFEADDTEPLEDFYPASEVAVEGWELLLRQPSKKKLTSQRFWKKVWVTVTEHGVVQLHHRREDRDPFQELPLQACYSLSEVGAQQYDAYGKIFTVKLQYVFYRERVGVRPGQISKVAQGQLAKLGLPLEHAPQVSQLLKIGSQHYTELRAFVRLLEDALFRLTVHRDRALAYKTEEVQVTVVDELRADVAASGVVRQQLARVRVFFLAFITSMPDVEIGLNDLCKQGKEVVGRHDIIPVVTEEWIRLEKCEFHSCVLVDEFDKHRNIKCHPPDACFFELMRFRIRPPRNRELPLQVKTTMSVIGNRVEIRADVLVPGCISRKHGQIPCEDVAIRFPLPECWIYLFRVEKHFRYGSVKSASRKPGKIKGLERFMGGGLSVEPSLIEVSTGQAKYEHHHRAIVWRIPRLPKDGQGAYTTQLFLCRMELTSYDQIPEEFDRYVYAEFTMPATTVSHTTVRSVSVTNPNPPEKYVKYLARHEYRIEMEHVNVASECEYIAAATAVSSAAGSSSTTTGGSDGSPVPSQ